MRYFGRNQPSLDDVVIDNDLVCEALDHLEQPYREAFLLRYFAGWPIQNRDPRVRTISRHFRRDPHTIRTWLRKAKEILQRCGVALIRRTG